MKNRDGMYWLPWIGNNLEQAGRVRGTVGVVGDCSLLTLPACNRIITTRLPSSSSLSWTILYIPLGRRSLRTRRAEQRTEKTRRTITKETPSGIIWLVGNSTQQREKWGAVEADGMATQSSNDSTDDDGGQIMDDDAVSVDGLSRAVMFVRPASARPACLPGHKRSGGEAGRPT